MATFWAIFWGKLGKKNPSSGHAVPNGFKVIKE